MGGDASSSSSSSVASPSSSSLAAVVQPLSLGLIGPSSSTQSPSSPWRSAPGPEPSTPSSPATENRTIVSVRRDSGLDGERGAVTPRLRRQSLNRGERKGRSTRLVTTRRRSHREFGNEKSERWKRTQGGEQRGRLARDNAVIVSFIGLSRLRRRRRRRERQYAATRVRGIASRECVEQSHRVPLSSNLRTSVALPFLTLERITGTIERSTSTLKTRGACRRSAL